MMLHLQRVSESLDCKMNISNLSRIFGPSLVGNSTPNLPPAEIINEVKIQQQIVENLLRLPHMFYMKFLEVTEPRMFKNAPTTPELLRKSKTASVLSSVLGPASNNVSQQRVQQTGGSLRTNMKNYASRTPK